jgi:membrane protein
MFRSLLAGMRLRDLARAVWVRVFRDRCLGTAAELGFYFMMSLFPFLIFVLSLLTFIPGARDLLVSYIARFAPPEAMRLLQGWVDTVFTDRNGSVLSFSFVFSLWTASMGAASLMELLTAAYEIEEGRSFWRSRLVAVALTVALTVLVIGGAFTITLGQPVLEHLVSRVGWSDAFATIWVVTTYCLGLLMLFAGMTLVYLYGPNVQQKVQWVLPGALFSIAATVMVSYGFTLYLRFFPSFDLTYGSLGAAIVLMFWLYLISLVILIGGEINSEIHLAAGRPRVEKEPA